MTRMLELNKLIRDSDHRILIRFTNIIIINGCDYHAQHKVGTPISWPDQLKFACYGPEMPWAAAAALTIFTPMEPFG